MSTGHKAVTAIDGGRAPQGFTRIVLDEPFTVFAAGPRALEPSKLEDIWERHGTGRLYLVLEGGSPATEHAIARAALGHRPTIAFARAHGDPSALREAVIVTMLRLRPGDVMVVVSHEAAAVAGYVRQGVLWRSSFDVPEGELHSLHGVNAGDAL